MKGRYMQRKVYFVFHKIKRKFMSYWKTLRKRNVIALSRLGYYRIVPEESMIRLKDFLISF